MAAKARLSRWPGARPASSLRLQQPPASCREPTFRAVLCTDRVPPTQDTSNDFKLAPQPDGGGDSKCNTTTHDTKMPPDGDSGVTNSGTLNEPPDGYQLAEEPGAGGAPPDVANLERLANKDQVNTTEDGDTLHKVAS